MEAVIAPSQLNMNHAEHLAFLEINEATREAMRAFAPVCEPYIDGILDAFYRHITQYGNLRALVKDENNIKRLKQAQKDHWALLFKADLDAQYVQRVQVIGHVHEKIGLEPRWYLGGYCMVMTHLTEIALKHYADDPAMAQTVLQAVSKIIFLDMELVISLYNENIRQTAKDRLKEAVSSIHDQLNTVAAAIEEMTASLQEISSNAARGAGISRTLKRSTEATESKVSDLSKSAQEITAVVDIIKDISSQTNLLSLNATIEAARAGEAGRGFAVVAAEVKELAKKSSESAEFITDKTREMIHNLKTSTEALSEIVGIIPDMDQITQSNASAVEEQNTVANEVSRSIARVLMISQQMTDQL